MDTHSQHVKRECKFQLRPWCLFSHSQGVTGVHFQAHVTSDLGSRVTLFTFTSGCPPCGLAWTSLRSSRDRPHAIV
eukprot:4927245-Amphidinium_carterae.1